MNQTQILPRGSIGFALGIAGMLVSLYFSIEFITGNASGAELIAGVVFCLILDYGKVSLASEAMLAMIQFRLLSAVCYTLIVICLYGLSMMAATFMLTTHATSAIVEQSDSKIAAIQAQIEAKRKDLDACPAGILTKCINPRTAELTALQAELSAAQNVSRDVLEAKDRAATWQKFAKALGTTPEDLQIKINLGRAILLEILAPLFVSLFLAAYRKRMPQPAQYMPSQRHEIQIEQPINAMRKEPTQKQELPSPPKMDMAKLAKK